MGRVLIVFVALVTMGTAAHATTLAAGAIFGGPTQNTVVCYLYNAGNSSVSVSGSIVQQFIGPVPLAINQCTGGVLAGGGICGIAANAINNAPYACNFVISPDAAAVLVRGTLELRNGLTVLQNEQLR